jgi:hypothetical protein
MDKVLLIGNDINNISNSVTWENILSHLIKEFNCKITFSKSKPLPFLFEEIYQNVFEKGIYDERDITSEIISRINEIKPNVIHEELIAMDVTHYVTTNYDYTLQKVILKNDFNYKSFKNLGIKRETKFSIFRHNLVNEKKFWHIHGEINSPKSLTIGYEQYGGSLQHIRSYTIEDFLRNYQKTSFENGKSWIDLFFTSDVHILGLSLDFLEMDLWWLLIYRAQYQVKKNKKWPNKIVYYCPQKYQNKEKEDLLKSNNVEIQHFNLEGLEFYRECISKINS